MRNAVVRTLAGRRATTAVTVLAATLAASLATGCAPLTEHEKYERAERLTLAQEEYAVREEHCINMGGVMHMQTRPLEKPSSMDYRAARCVRR